ncbi:MAG: hypothetical protein VYE54_00755 [Pseudomonadota bacterium]|nr:hypothetical protein [Pseudomonadota bacterium]
MTVLQFNSAKQQKGDGHSQELLPLSIFQHRQELTISYRGSLAEKVSEINCKEKRDQLLQELAKSNFRDCVVYWDNLDTLVVGLLDDVGEYYPDW